MAEKKVIVKRLPAIRTRRNPWKSRPNRWLAIAEALEVLFHIRILSPKVVCWVTRRSHTLW